MSVLFEWSFRIFFCVRISLFFLLIDLIDWWQEASEKTKILLGKKSGEKKRFCNWCLIYLSATIMKKRRKKTKKEKPLVNWCLMLIAATFLWYIWCQTNNQWSWWIWICVACFSCCCCCCFFQTKWMFFFVRSCSKNIDLFTDSVMIIFKKKMTKYRYSLIDRLNGCGLVLVMAKHSFLNLSVNGWMFIFVIYMILLFLSPNHHMV